MSEAQSVDEALNHIPTNASICYKAAAHQHVAYCEQRLTLSSYSISKPAAPLAAPHTEHMFDLPAGRPFGLSQSMRPTSPAVSTPLTPMVFVIGLIVVPIPNSSGAICVNIGGDMC